MIIEHSQIAKLFINDYFENRKIFYSCYSVLSINENHYYDHMMIKSIISKLPNITKIVKYNMQTIDTNKILITCINEVGNQPFIETFVLECLNNDWLIKNHIIEN